MNQPAVNTSGLSVGARCTVIIEDIAFGGEGVARIEDFVVFVPFVLVGEMVEVEITEVKKRFARARLLRCHQRFARARAAAVPVFRRLRRLPVSAH